MRAYIMIVAVPVFGMFALVYTARTHDRTYAGLNCTVECSGHARRQRHHLRNLSRGHPLPPPSN